MNREVGLTGWKRWLLQRWNLDHAAILLCFLFLIICFNFSTHISLWGDEAFSLKTAEGSWLDVLNLKDTHLPTHSIVLKLIILGTGSSSEDEIWIRLAHSILFGIGLFFSYKILTLVLQSKVDSLRVLLVAIFIPSFIFYATNIRMYSMLFLFSSWFIYQLVKMLIKQDLTSKRDWFWFVVSASLLILTDYPGLIIYTTGTIFLIRRIVVEKRWILLTPLFLPLASYVVYLHLLIPGLESILAWQKPFSLAQTQQDWNFKKIAGSIYHFCRPIVDLVNPAGMSSGSALLLSGLLICFTPLAGIAFLHHKEQRHPVRVLLVCIAFLWLLGISKGLNVTRVFLPSIFFMAALLVVGFTDFRSPWKAIGWAFFSLLLIINLQQVFQPTLRVYSMIPYRQIALDCLTIAKQQNIHNIVISAHTLNSLSIQRYVQQEAGSDFVSALLPVEYDSSSLPPNPFIFVSHMHESQLFIDVQKFQQDFGRKVTNAKNYIDLEQLPFNSLWRNEIAGRTTQKFAVSTYIVE